MGDEGIEYVDLVEKAVKYITKEKPGIDAIELCWMAFPQLGLPQAAVSPLTAKTVMAHLYRG